MKKVLIVDDEEKIRILIKKYCDTEGIESEQAENGQVALEKFRKDTFNLIILDVMMPEMDGLEVLTEIRHESNIPVIILSGRGEEYDKISGFELGVDDYVVKPFSPKELMLRINAILKRAESVGSVSEAKRNIYENKGLKIDYDSRIVTVDGNKINLTPKEMELLFFFIRNKNIALTREKLMTNIWGYTFFSDDRTLDTHIKMLRKNLGEYSALIVTLRGIGYRYDG